MSIGRPQVPQEVRRQARPTERLGDPERSLTATLTGAWQALVRVMGEERAQEFRDYLRARGLDILPTEYAIHVSVFNLALTSVGKRPVADVSIYVDRLGKVDIERVRIHKDVGANGNWGLDLPASKVYEDGEWKRFEPRFRLTGVYARHVVRAMLEAFVDAGMLPATELNRVKRIHHAKDFTTGRTEPLRLGGLERAMAASQERVVEEVTSGEPEIDVAT